MANLSTMEKKDLLITAAQAQLELCPAEEERLQQAVSGMLEYFSLMKTIDVETLAPTTHALVQGNALRSDNNPDNNCNNINPEDFVNRAPDHDDNFIVIPNVL